MTKEELQQKYEVLILEIISCDPENFDGIFYEIVDLKCKEFEQLQQENQQLKEKYNIRSKAYDKVLLENVSLKDKEILYKEVIEEVRYWLSSVIIIEKTLPFYEGIKRVDVNELLQILDKVKEN